jgi:hypothetical protein
MGEGCLSSIFGFIIFVIVFTVLVKAGLFGYMAGSLTLFNQLLEEVFKSLISILRDGTIYNPGY